MSSSNPESVFDLAALAVLAREPASLASVEADVMALFDRCGPSLCRYVVSCGLAADQAEDVVQDVFLALFRHLCLGRPRTNLRAWLFQVAHNLASKERRKRRRREWLGRWDAAKASQHADPSPGPEARLADDERHARLRAVFNALPERDRHCLFLRAEGLRYREIANALGMSLGAVAKSLGRSIPRFVNVEKR
jgi:RNA polymerase sigma-70 factor, ECF subfamily